MKNRLIQLARIVLGLLFLFSGFVKCVDPTGGAIKIEDYFVAWGMEWMPFGVCMALSLAQNIIEFTVGYLLVANIYLPIASIVALAFMCFYTPLTLYIALANPVSDCGCFGDAVKLSNWQTFWKNTAFLPLAIFVFLTRYSCPSRLRGWRLIAVAGIGAMVALLISVKGITDEPIIDYRPYSVGTDINLAMQIPDDAPLPEYKTTFILEKNGVRQEFDEVNYPYEDSTWVYIDAKTEVISEGYVPPIKDFTLTDRDGNVQTDAILSSNQPVILAISPKVEEISDSHLKSLSVIAEAQETIGRQMYILTSSSSAAQNALDNRAQRGFDYLQGDETMLKTITRSNPGIIIVQDGIIIAKYHIDHMPVQGIANPLATNLTNIEAENARLVILSVIFAVALLILFIVGKRRRG